MIGKEYIKITLHLILQLGIITLFYIIGVFLQHKLSIPIPGSIIGMFLLFGLLLSGKLPEGLVNRGSTTILSHLQLLFIPVTIGVIDHMEFFSGTGLLSVLVVLMSTSIVIIITGVVTQRLIFTKEDKDVSR